MTMKKQNDQLENKKFSKCRELESSVPLASIVRTTAMVSTFVTVVGQPKTPTLAGNGGFKRGLPVLPTNVMLE